MAKHGIEIKVGATVVQGPRGFSIKDVKFKETLANGDNVYQVLLEDNSVIGEILVKKGDKGDRGEVGATGNGIDKIELIDEGEDYRTYRITFTNGTNFDWTVNDGYSAYEIAVDNGFEGTEQEWLESLIGKGLEFEWKGTQLGVRVEGETEYKYVDLKGQAGENGKNLEFNWKGTELGVRVHGQADYQYVNLKGEKGNPGQNGTNGADGNGIKDMAFKETDSQGNNIYTITFTNGKTFDITVPRGPKGEGATIDLSNYYTKPEIDTKFKNYCPISVGSIDVRYDNKNPAELYPSTTWELLAAGKYIQSGSTALQTGGSNSINIAKTNLPNVKLSIGSFSATIGAHNHYIFANGTGSDSSNVNLTPVTNRHNSASVEYVIHWSSTRANKGRTSDSGNGTTGSVSPYTESLGSGTALTVQPAYITLKFWKRLS